MFDSSLECELPKRSSNRTSVSGLSHSVNDNDVETRLKRVEQLIVKLSEAVFPHSKSSLNRAADKSDSLDALGEGHDPDTVIAHNYPKPVEILQDLQSELYAHSGQPSSEETNRLDVVSVGLLSFETAVQLLRT